MGSPQRKTIPLLSTLPMLSALKRNSFSLLLKSFPMVLIPGVVYLHILQKVISVWYPTEITFCRPTEGYFCRACQVLTLRQVMQPSLSNFVSTYKKKSSKFGDNFAGGGDRNLRSSTYRTDALAY